jgi:hypothetical protein
MNKVATLKGKWRIVEMELWDKDFLDMMDPACIAFDGKAGGEFAFGCVTGSLHCRKATSGVEFTWKGNDEMDEASGAAGPRFKKMGRSMEKSASTMATIQPSRPDLGEFFSSLLDVSVQTRYRAWRCSRPYIIAFDVLTRPSQPFSRLLHSLYCASLGRLTAQRAFPEGSARSCAARAFICRPCRTGGSGALSRGTSAKRSRKSGSSLMKFSTPRAIPGAFRHPDARLRRATASMRGRPQPDRC